VQGNCRGKSERSIIGWQAGGRVSWGDTSSFCRIIKGRVDGRNPLGRFRKVLWIVGSHEGAGRLQCKHGRGPKLRRGAEPSIRAIGAVGSTCGIVYRGFVSQSSKIVQQEPRYHDTRYRNEP
jgi:hypothetical protein